MTSAAGNLVLDTDQRNRFRRSLLLWAEVKVLTNYISAHWCETRRAAAFVANSVPADLAFIAPWNQFLDSFPR